MRKTKGKKIMKAKKEREKTKKGRKGKEEKTRREKLTRRINIKPPETNIMTNLVYKNLESWG